MCVSGAPERFFFFHLVYSTLHPNKQAVCLEVTLGVTSELFVVWEKVYEYEKIDCSHKERRLMGYNIVCV